MDLVVALFARGGNLDHRLATTIKSYESASQSNWEKTVFVIVQLTPIACSIHPTLFDRIWAWYRVGLCAIARHAGLADRSTYRRTHLGAYNFSNQSKMGSLTTGQLGAYDSDGFGQTPSASDPMSLR